VERRADSPDLLAHQSWITVQQPRQFLGRLAPSKGKGYVNGDAPSHSEKVVEVKKVSLDKKGHMLDPNLGAEARCLQRLEEVHPIDSHGCFWLLFPARYCARDGRF
jgi:hypothetical protein